MNLSISTNQKKYKVIFDLNLEKNLHKYLHSLDFYNNYVLIYPSNVSEYAENIFNYLENKEFKVKKIEIEDGEKYKNLDNFKEILEKLHRIKCNKNSTLICIGGGSIGDIIGFVSSIYMRGIKYINIPTTLLSMVDSSIGGKSAINFKGVKNLIGSIYQPELVLINPNYIKTLNQKEIRSGFGEIIKYGLIFNPKILDKLYKNISCFIQFNDMNIVTNIIYDCCVSKKYFIELDEFDSHERNKLNFGHTLGHVIENKYQYKDITHGQAILNGMYLAIQLSFNKNILPKDEYKKISKYLDLFKIKNEFKLILEDLDKLLYDKKSKNGNIRFILLKGIGQPVVFDDITQNEIKGII